jgi:hypothetical protein
VVKDDPRLRVWFWNDLEEDLPLRHPERQYR